MTLRLEQTFFPVGGAILVAFVSTTGACADSLFGNSGLNYEESAYCQAASTQRNVPATCAGWCGVQAKTGSLPAGWEPYACASGARRCSDAGVENCDGKDWSLIKTCGAGTACDESSHECKDLPCTKDAKRCNANNVETCNGVDWSVSKSCAAGSTCNSSTFQCDVPPACAKDAKRCTAGNVEVCDGTAWTLSKTCEANTSCDSVSFQCVDHRSTMVSVPGGTMVLGDSNSSDNPTRSVTLATFELDIYEATVAAYRDCVNAKACSTDGLSSGNLSATDKDNHPINFLNWNDAGDFCAWAGKRLPTEWEWEYAARYDDSRKYPWGTLDPMDNPEIVCYNTPTTCPVGSKPASDSKLGIKDLAGNVSEWTDSWYCDTPPCASGSKRVLRGGSWKPGDLFFFPTYVRGVGVPTDHLEQNGVRCARGS